MSTEERVLVLLGESSEHLRPLLECARIEVVFCRDARHLSEELSHGAAALLCDISVFSDAGHVALREFLETQPPWADLPVVLFTGVNARLPYALCAWLGNVVLVERESLLLHALHGALRTRRRQYHSRNRMEALERALGTFGALEAPGPRGVLSAAVAAWASNFDPTGAPRYPGAGRLPALAQRPPAGPTSLDGFLPKVPGRQHARLADER